jgi:hypothetical protein
MAQWVQYYYHPPVTVGLSYFLPRIRAAKPMIGARTWFRADIRFHVLSAMDLAGYWILDIVPPPMKKRLYVSIISTRNYFARPHTKLSRDTVH